MFFFFPPSVTICAPPLHRYLEYCVYLFFEVFMAQAWILSYYVTTYAWSKCRVIFFSFLLKMTCFLAKRTCRELPTIRMQAAVIWNLWIDNAALCDRRGVGWVRLTNDSAKHKAAPDCKRPGRHAQWLTRPRPVSDGIRISHQARFVNDNAGLYLTQSKWEVFAPIKKKKKIK